MFDAEKFNGFIKDELDDLLFGDIWEYFVFNESDLHSAAYYYIRKYFEKRDSDSSRNIFVRCEPVMADGKKPDIVVFQGYDPIYMLEIKMFRKPEEIWAREDAIDKDLDKLKSYLEQYSTIKWVFQIVVYDSEQMWKPSDYLLKKSGYKNTKILKINLRYQEENNRRRVRYDEWRKQFDKFIDKHF